MPTEANPPKVFISYNQDTQEHFDRVLLLLKHGTQMGHSIARLTSTKSAKPILY
ncbi:MAG: hypothetical protein JST85_14915 [Acidobacteria bacterium]|nr:hypothetical protein [Acidobacteriota bacterium]